MGTGTGSEPPIQRAALESMPTADQGVIASFAEVFHHLLEHLIAAQELAATGAVSPTLDELGEAERLCRRVLGILAPSGPPARP